MCHLFLYIYIFLWSKSANSILNTNLQICINKCDCVTACRCNSTVRLLISSFVNSDAHKMGFIPYQKWCDQIAVTRCEVNECLMPLGGSFWYCSTTVIVRIHFLGVLEVVPAILDKREIIIWMSCTETNYPQFRTYGQCHHCVTGLLDNLSNHIKMFRLLYCNNLL